MPSCPSGHEQRLGLKCAVCGAPLSYRGAVDELRDLPRVEPEYGGVSILSVGCGPLPTKADYVGEVSIGQADLETSRKFQVANILGGNWLDFQKKHLPELRRWMTLVGIQKTANRLLVVDTTSPLSVLALSAFPNVHRTTVIGITADPDSTPVEQNTSYVALSLALKKGFPIIALSETFKREMLYFTDEGALASGTAAVSRLLEPMLAAPDDLTDLLERDMKLGIRMHCLSAILAGSKEVYGIATNAFMAQSYNVSLGTKADDYQTLHSIVFSRGESEAEFEKSFGVFRNRKLKGALSAEFRFHETASPLYDLVTIYGMRNDTSLQGIASGYETIVKNVPELSAEGVS